MSRLTGTTLVVAKRALVDALTARLAGVSGMGQVGVHYSMPTKQIGREAIWLDDSASLDQTWRWVQAGTKPTRETWETSVVLQLQRNRSDISEGQDPVEQAELRAVAIYREIQQAIAEDPQLGEASLLWCELEAGGLIVDRQAAAMQVRLAMTFRGHAELFPDP